MQWPEQEQEHQALNWCYSNEIDKQLEKVYGNIFKWFSTRKSIKNRPPVFTTRKNVKSSFICGII